MKTSSAALLAHRQGEVTTLAVCWRITRDDGVLILGTEHDQDLTIDEGSSPPNPLAGTYLARAGITGSNVRSTSDLSVDNMEVEGAIATDLNVLDLSAADIEAGLLDDASVELFLVNWQAPNDGQDELRTGTIGEIHRTAEGQYRTELRGLTQALSQTIVRTCGTACDAVLFDSRCKLSRASFTYEGVVTDSRTRRHLTATFGSPAPDMSIFNGGKVTFTSGANSGHSMEVKNAAYGSPEEILLFLVMPLNIEPSDTFTIEAGCDHSYETCRDVFLNVLNFRGHGIFTPGMTEILKVGGQE